MIHSALAYQDPTTCFQRAARELVKIWQIGGKLIEIKNVADGIMIFFSKYGYSYESVVHITASGQVFYNGCQELSEPEQTPYVKLLNEQNQRRKQWAAERLRRIQNGEQNNFNQ